MSKHINRGVLSDLAQSIEFFYGPNGTITKQVEEMERQGYEAWKSLAGPGPKKFRIVRAGDIPLTAEDDQ